MLIGKKASALFLVFRTDWCGCVRCAPALMELGASDEAAESTTLPAELATASTGHGTREAGSGAERGGECGAESVTRSE